MRLECGIPLAWDAALRMSRVDLQIIPDENMYNFVENSIRGGISMRSLLVTHKPIIHPFQLHMMLVFQGKISFINKCK